MVGYLSGVARRALTCKQVYQAYARAKRELYSIATNTSSSRNWRYGAPFLESSEERGERMTPFIDYVIRNCINPLEALTNKFLGRKLTELEYNMLASKGDITYSNARLALASIIKCGRRLAKNKTRPAVKDIASLYNPK